MKSSEPSACNLVSIIVLNWNGRSLLDECLSALSKQTYSPYELIFVGNGSTDGSIDFVPKKILGSAFANFLKIADSQWVILKDSRNVEGSILR